MGKSVFASKTLWLNFISLIAMGLQGAGLVEITGDEQTAIAIAAVNVVNIVLRMITKKPIVVSGLSDTPMGFIIVAMMLTIPLGACGTISGLGDSGLNDDERAQLNLQQKLYEAQGEFNILLGFANSYSDQPFCDEIIVVACAERSVVIEMSNAAGKIKVALDLAKENTTDLSISGVRVGLRSLNTMMAAKLLRR